jgi:acyl carrier protein
MSHRNAIIAQLVEVFEEDGIAPPVEFADDLVLLELGLDSLGFAVLVTNICDQLGFDPFVESELPFYPETLGEFIAFYDARRG